ncbi:hypothetical protein [Methylacidimicrobium sp. B4]|uniref:hypothetical protein n=1 Tax=Methylacidimicrobium sp. B4 TaxID=2796139 RepID=UPI001A8D6D61|nr:hypothetical protein [Methylacidimicrobium sp. B4]QSR85152.1 hypothetical protein MacB4_02495 [Methylacidimicrobium sp. B4]
MTRGLFTEEEREAKRDKIGDARGGPMVAASIVLVPKQPLIKDGKVVVPQEATPAGCSLSTGYHAR